MWPRSRPAWAVALLLAVPVTIVVTAPPCLGCECVPRTPAKILKQADAAFVGRAVGSIFLDDTRSIQRFEVEGVFEGVLSETVDVQVELGGDCPTVVYPQGERVGVVLRLQPDGSLATFACDFLPLPELERVAAPARLPVPDVTASPPVAADRPAETGTDLPRWAVAGLGVLGALVLIAISMAGGRRKRVATPPAIVPGNPEEEDP